MSLGRVCRAHIGVLAGCVFGLAATWVSSAGALSNSVEERCTGRTAASAEQRVQACSSLIDSRAFSGDQLAILYTSRGSAWRAKGDADRALADQNEAVRLKSGSALLYFNRAVTWRSKGEANRAISDYGEAIRLAPNFALAYKNRGDIFLGIADYDRAIADYDSALRLKSNYAEALARRGLARLQNGDVEGRNADLKVAHSFDAETVAALFGPRGIASSMGQGFMVRRQLSAFSALELSGATICMQAGAESEQRLKGYFEAHAMKYTLRDFATFDDALRAYSEGRCDVLAGRMASLTTARPKLSQPESHTPLPEVFAR
jgi:tetratricopeptide (TPR) repeat protein